MTVEDVIKFSNGRVNPKEICKTLILKDQENNSYAIVALGSDRVDFEKVRKRFGSSKLRLATQEEIKQETGLEIGAVCPLFLDLPMLIDKRVFSRKKVNFGSGDHMFGIEMNPKDILKCVKAKISI
jgi:prolyl-tRNA editing enzyme YbaK/EbsC (Cys-tRNA(Pro) deacylase)